MVRKMTEEEENYRKMICEEAIMKAKKIMLQGNIETNSAYELVSAGSYDNSIWLYERFKETMEQTVISIVLPSLINKCNAPLLRDFTLMLSNYRLMATWLCRFFEYLGRNFICHYDPMLPLNEISHNCFQDMVIRELYSEFQAAAISLINQERMGLHIDHDLLKKVVLSFMEFHKDEGVSYYEDFEMAMLEETATYYSQLTRQWLLCDSSEEYIQKVSWCLDQEKGRASCYWPLAQKCHNGIDSINAAFMERFGVIVRCQLLDQTVDKLIEKQKAENCGLLTDYQEMLSQYAGMTLKEGSSASTLGDWLAALLAKSTQIF
ncbi:hypothetical protein RCOM_1432220 [Ricinus communis]|uniref:Cullin N-terminal domain-containing protein n=1 Tax=Ricinus communis TaxID=3988 RepID=B9RF83_RICCO|nr:hypothetical protein RCOM_1432220 [Ricinus communis]